MRYMRTSAAALSAAVDTTKLIRDNRHLTGGTNFEEASPPNASRSSGEGVRGRGASLREAASPPESCLSLPRTSVAALSAAVDITKLMRDTPPHRRNHL